MIKNKLLTIDFYEYLAIDAVNSHKLMKCLLSYEHLLNEQDSNSEALRIGRLIHEECLEPNKEKSYVIAPKFDRRTKEGKANTESFAISNIGKEFINSEDFMVIQGVKARFESLFPVLLSYTTLGCFEAEQSLVFDLGNLIGKARFDLISIDHELKKIVICDLKTTDNALYFKSSCSKYNYDLQLAWYETAVTQAFPDYSVLSYIVAIEKLPPFEGQIFHIEKNEIGFYKLNKALNNYMFKDSTYVHDRAISIQL